MGSAQEESSTQGGQDHRTQQDDRGEGPEGNRHPEENGLPLHCQTLPVLRQRPIHLPHLRALRGEGSPQSPFRSARVHPPKHAGRLQANLQTNLHHLHAKKIFHCNLIPEHILIAEAGEEVSVKIIGFGNAVNMESQKKEGHNEEPAQLSKEQKINVIW